VPDARLDYSLCIKVKEGKDSRIQTGHTTSAVDAFTSLITIVH